MLNWETFKAKLPKKRGRRTGAFVLPSVVLDLQPDFVAGARLDRSKRLVRRIAIRQLETGALDPLPGRNNLTKPEVVRRAIREVLETLGNPGGPLGILLPDPSVRVAILHFETLPGHREEAESLVRWKMGGILPFPPEEARVSYQFLPKEDHSVELLAMALKNSVIAEYEAAFEMMSASPALILPATVALLPLLPSGNEASHVLVHVCSGSMTTVVAIGDGISVWRNRLLDSHTAAGDGEVVREIGRVVATCRDHLKREIENLFVYVRPPAGRSLEKEISEATGQQVELLTSSLEPAVNLPPAEKKILDGFGMPFAGLLENHN